ncbi:hypothetical protein P7C70_g5738, partial [Phenoliferia sp. Uapishka_3]
MGFFSNDGNHAQAYNDVYSDGSEEHKSSWSHEAIGGAAAFAAAKAYEDKCARDGKPDNHAMATTQGALLLGSSYKFPLQLFETKGLDFIDREKAKRHAKQEAEAAVGQDY